MALKNSKCCCSGTPLSPCAMTGAPLNTAGFRLARVYELVVPGMTYTGDPPECDRCPGVSGSYTIVQNGYLAELIDDGVIEHDAGWSPSTFPAYGSPGQGGCNYSIIKGMSTKCFLQAACVDDPETPCDDSTYQTGVCGATGSTYGDMTAIMDISANLILSLRLYGFAGSASFGQGVGATYNATISTPTDPMDDLVLNYSSGGLSCNWPANLTLERVAFP